MKILIIPSWYPTEDKPINGIYIKEQAAALSERGHNVAVLYPDLRFKISGLKTGITKNQNKNLQTFIYRKRNETPFIEIGMWLQRFRMIKKLYKLYFNEFGKPDIVHLHSCRMAYEAVKLCKKYDLPLIYTEHYSGVLNPVRKNLQYQLKLALESSCSAIAVSESLKKAMLKFKNHGENSIECIPNYVDTQKFAPVKREKTDCFIFGAMGNLVPIKGYDILLRAFAQAADDLKNAVLKIAGGGPEENRLKQLAKSLNINERVIFEGEIPRIKVPDFYRNCDCFICSSFKETFGIVNIEALSCGVPVIATNCGGPESVINSGNGVLCNPGDVSGLSSAMLYMYKNIDRYIEQDIRNDCIHRFSKDSVCSRLEMVYNKAVRLK